MIDLTGEIALVTGASRGIGEAIVHILNQQGATVLGTATTPSGAEAITQRLQAQSGRGEGFILDVTETSAMNALLTDIEKRYGILTILVNNAGITRDGLLMRMKEEDWDAVLATHLTGLFHVTQRCIKGMVKARKGRIINIASVVGAMGNAGQTNYAAAKAGMMGFTKALAREVGSRGITVNAIAPGFIDTDMTRKLPEEQKATLLANIPLNRLGTPQEIAHAVAFLASPEAAYITGVTLHVNGGLYMS